MSNSKCLVNALSGTIDIQSKVDKGTIVTFSVDIVLAKDKKKWDKNEVISDAIESNLGGQYF